MNIAILGWGSLVPDPRGLPIAGPWQIDGPMLSIEFSRISRSRERADCLTLVIDERCGSEITTLHVPSTRAELPQAVADLQECEGTHQDDIGFCEVAGPRFAARALRRHPTSCDRIRAWALRKGFDAAIWTALPPRFRDAIGIPFTPAAALNYLNGLPPATKELALQYIRTAPPQTTTAFRRLLLAQINREPAAPNNPA
jgi:sirohydrochlorin ferrochelatase